MGLHMETLFAFIFIAFDMLTGVFKGWKMKELVSSKMREGLFNKAGFILTIALGMLIDKAQQYFSLGFQVKLTVAISIFIILIEIVSIFENICAINPMLANSKIAQHFLRKDDEE